MSSATVTGPLFDGGPVMLDIEDESSLWHVREELRGGYLAAVEGFTRSTIREVETNVRAGLSGRQTIRSSWLLGLRAEARSAAGLDPIPLDRVGNYRVTEAWPEELSGFDALTGWALHIAAVEEAIDAAKSQAMRDALTASTGSARCPACSVPVTGPGAELCAPCSMVVEVVRLDRARELGRERIEGRHSRAQLVEAWLDR